MSIEQEKTPYRDIYLAELQMVDINTYRADEVGRITAEQKETFNKERAVIHGKTRKERGEAQNRIAQTYLNEINQLINGRGNDQQINADQDRLDQLDYYNLKADLQLPTGLSWEHVDKMAQKRLIDRLVETQGTP